MCQQILTSKTLRKVNWKYLKSFSVINYVIKTELIECTVMHDTKPITEFLPGSVNLSTKLKALPLRSFSQGLCCKTYAISSYLYSVLTLRSNNKTNFGVSTKQLSRSFPYETEIFVGVVMIHDRVICLFHLL